MNAEKSLAGKVALVTGASRGVSTRAYNQRSLEETLQGCLAEREKSLEWLRGLVNPDWQKSESTSWAGHDLLHMRQLVELQRAYIVHLTRPCSLDYAGEW